MQRPNFFIIGAPKCGTTSLAAWLAGHDRVFIPKTKEPHFFNSDGRPMTRSRRHYERLFADAGPEHAAVGEASTGYLSSRHAVSEILDYAPDARFMVCLRNPVDMAISLHEQRVFEGKERIRDFEQAWRAQENRQAKQKRTDLHYAHTCEIGTQMARLFQHVERHRVFIVLFDDMRRDATAIYRRALAFLDLPEDGRNHFPAHNTAKARRFPGLNHLTRIAADSKRHLGIQRGLGILNRIDRGNTSHRQRPPVPAHVRRELATYFESDVARLSATLDRDFSHWLRGETHRV